MADARGAQRAAPGRCRFYEVQPDLNATNPEGREELRRILGFWLERGVAGFRIDAVPFLLEHTTPERAGLRKECPEIGWGRWTLLSAGSPHVLALRHHCRDSSVVTVHSFAPWPQAVRLRPGVEGGDRLVDLLEEGGSRARRSGAHHVALPAFGFRWYRVGGLNYALHRARQSNGIP